MKKSKLYNVTLTTTELQYIMDLLENNKDDGAAEELLVEIKLQTIWGDPKK